MKLNQFTLHCIASTPNVNVIVMGGEGSFDPNVYRVDACGDSNGDGTDQKRFSPKLPNVYHLKRNQGQLRLDCSRELRLPFLDIDSDYSNFIGKSQPKAHLTCMSTDGLCVAVCLSDGFVWFYSLHLISWFYSISTNLALSAKRTRGFGVFDVFNQTNLLMVTGDIIGS